MITPRGDITEYGVFGWGQKENEKWPRAIMHLEPLFRLFSDWRKELESIEATQTDVDQQPRTNMKQPAEQPGPAHLCSFARENS